MSRPSPNLTDTQVNNFHAPKVTNPLCNECLQIILKAKHVDITFLNVSDGYKRHPHLGATDQNGNFGYVHDETALKRNPPLWQWDTLTLNATCNQRDSDFKMLTERVHVAFDYHERAEQEERLGQRKRPKLFCVVYTIDSGHFKIPFIRETWGCVNHCLFALVVIRPGP